MLLEDTNRLEKIDELYSLRLDQYISLPMLVVVGDQSSGKSSVLEGLTGLPLPRDSGLCTRFPTQIVFKRSPNEYIEVSINPPLELDADKKAAFATFHRKHSRAGATLEPNKLLDILKEAAEQMNVPAIGQAADEGLHSFSHDVLKIELSGPQYEHFSVVDLPGLFRKPTPGQTTREDMTLVRKMVSDYLKNPRSIILAVVPANVDLATQEIVQMAEDADPERKRTLGVLTKPDLVDEGAEDKIIDLLMGHYAQTSLGYIALCNRSQSKLGVSTLQRHENEADFFNTDPWRVVPKHQVGISSLKTRLNKLLVDITRNSFADVALEIDQRLIRAQKELEQIGSSRDSPADQRLFLLQTVTNFQALATKAVDAYYGRDDCFERFETMRLATLIMSENEKFSETMFKFGSRRAFGASPEDDTEIDSDGEAQVIGTPDLIHTPNNSDEPVVQREFSELKALKSRIGAMPERSQEPVKAWISRKYDHFKGFEIGTINPSLLPALVREQTSSWQFYAMAHVHQVISHIHQCLYDLLHFVCSESSVCDRIWTRMVPKLKAAYATALDHTDFLVNVERSGYPVTLNHYFVDTLKKQRLSRIEKRLKSLKSWTTNDDEKQPLIRFADTVQVYITNDQHNVEELHDVLKSYHKVARKRFVDSICKQVVDQHLIVSAEGPLAVLSPRFIALLTENDLQVLAGEDVELSNRRKSLRLEVESLLKGQAVLLQ